MGINVKIVSYIGQVNRSIDSAASKKMREAVNVVKTQTLETLSGSRHGKIYRVPGTSRTYTASAPGEPPAVATSGLRKSIKSAVGSDGGAIVGRVGSDEKYARPLEYGTKNMKPRPWLRISLEAAASKVEAILSRGWL